jgi:hypothetical protein
MIEPEIKRQLDDLLLGRTIAAGQFSLATGTATTTTVTRTGV